jgi:hypothetical protein
VYSHISADGQFGIELVQGLRETGFGRGNPAIGDGEGFKCHTVRFGLSRFVLKVEVVCFLPAARTRS